MEKPKSYVYVAIGILVLLQFYTGFLFNQRGKEIEHLDSVITGKDSLISKKEAKLKEQSELIEKLNILLDECRYEKSTETLKSKNYENQLRSQQEECEHEIDQAIINSNIDNSNDNELGWLLSDIGRHNSLSDAERILLRKRKGESDFGNDSKGSSSGEKLQNRERKNKSP